MSTRAGIISALIARMKTITIHNGYVSDIGSKVYSWRLKPIPPDQLPVIEIRDLEAVMQVETLEGVTSHKLKCMAYIVCSGSVAADDARAGIADIAKALYTDLTLGGLVQGFYPTGHKLEMQQEEDLLVAGGYEFEVAYYSNPGEV